MHGFRASAVQRASAPARQRASASARQRGQRVSAPAEGICLPRCGDGESSCDLGGMCLGGVCAKLHDSGAGGLDATSTGDATAGPSGAGDQDDPCPENPRAECAIDCSSSSIDGGTATSQWDERGCYRMACTFDSDCEGGERCFGIDPGEPEVCIGLLTCREDEQVGGCVCGGGATCYPGYCVPL